MGGDGGTSATQRDFIVTVKKAPKQADQNEVQRFYFSCLVLFLTSLLGQNGVCALSLRCR